MKNTYVIKIKLPGERKFGVLTRNGNVDLVAMPSSYDHERFTSKRKAATMAARIRGQLQHMHKKTVVKVVKEKR